MILKKPKNRIFISLKYLIAKLIYLYSSYYLNNKIRKKKIISNIKGFFSDNLIEIKYKELTPKYNINFTKIENEFLIKNMICKVKINDKDNIFEQKSVFTCCLKNVKFFGFSGNILYKSKPVIEASCNISRLMPYRNRENLLSKSKKMKGIYTSIMHYFQENNYYHWLIDNIPRLYGITQINESKINIIVHDGINQNQISILKLFLDERFKLIAIKKNEIWKLEKFYFSSFITDDCSGFLPKLYLDFVKQKIINGLRIKPKNRALRLYVSRNKGKVRRLANENEFFEILKKYNFIKVYSEDLSFKEQASFFNSADIIVSTFGAGFSNLIFSDKCKVLELFPPKNIKTHYFMLCKALDFEYHYLIGYEQFGNQDFKIDLHKAENIIKELV